MGVCVSPGTAVLLPIQLLKPIAPAIYPSSTAHDSFRTATMSESIKGPDYVSVKYDASTLRIAIVHARWNKVVIDALVNGTVKRLKELGVKDSGIVIQAVPGSYELPFACSKYVHLCLRS